METVNCIRFSRFRRGVPPPVPAELDSVELAAAGGGNVIRVVATPGKSLLRTRINELLAFARKQGYRHEEVLAIFEAQVSR